MTRIVSAIPGRIRLRDRALRRSPRLDSLQAALAAVDGVTSVEANGAAGSLLLRYDSTRVEPRAMETRVEAAASAQLDAPELRFEPAGKRRLARQLNRCSKFGMLGSLAVSLAYAAAGKKRLHAATGGLFGAFLGIHMLVHRRHLLK